MTATKKLGLFQAALVFLGLMTTPTVQALAGGQTAHDFDFVSIDGENLPFASFAGKAVLVVNTASFCGFTGQYKELVQVWQDYKDKGLVVLGVPSGDFGNQEYGQEGEIKEFCELTYGVDFPMTEKQVVSGDKAHPFYLWAREELGFIAAPKWNFHKYLVAPDGTLVDWFSTPTSPTSDKVRKAIVEILPKAS